MVSQAGCLSQSTPPGKGSAASAGGSIRGCGYCLTSSIWLLRSVNVKGHIHLGTPNSKLSPSVPGLLALHVHHSQRPEFTQLPDQVGELHLCSPQHAAPLRVIFLPWFSPHDGPSFVRVELISEAFSALDKGTKGHSFYLRFSSLIWLSLFFILFSYALSCGGISC